ncbi:hypothetical protein [Streptomyces abyssomicinicus]|uniref:hypothetical protein n=1 Tax=Streptomyces abyssomicinicus TaxID=574929 RepID=UPI0012505C4E|nr:hypothetical protein [Streptomyces abyssomicinicus]
MSLGDDYGDGQTRTRMPERNELPPRRGRGGGRSSRGLVTGVGVIVLLIAAIAFANRGGDDTAGGDNAPATSPTAPTGERPVASGFAHDEQGAQSAAANYAVALGSAEMFDKGRRDTILEAIITPSRVPAFRSTLDKAYGPEFYQNVGLGTDGSAPTGFTFVSRTTPVGTKATDYSADKATVEVWCSGLLGLAGEGSTTPVTNSWFTITMQLEYVSGDWKITDHDQRDGPAPVPGDDKASSAGEIANAVEEYGGFTYAR